jgi:DNA-binding beta-propeller fold protein YncE
MRTLSLFTLLLASSGLVAAGEAGPMPSGGLMYMGTWPHHVLVMDENKQTVVDKIEMKTGVPFGLQLSADRKKLYVTTIEKSGIETVDLSTNKVIDSFVLDEGNRKERLAAYAIDKEGKFLYSIVAPTVKKIDRFEVEQAQFITVDLAQHKIVRRVDYPKDLDIYGVTGLTGSYEGGLKLSPDGKYLYLFRENILVFDTAEFKVVEKIELAKPSFQGMETVSFNLVDDAYRDPSLVTSLFVSADPFVHKPAFGLATVNLTTRNVDFTPVGPYTSGLMGLFVSPDQATGYTVSITGQNGNRRTEFWSIDMNTKRIVQRAEFRGRRRFNFALSPSGKSLYIYVAGFEVDIFDAKTLQHTKTVDLGSDVTTNMVVVPVS